MIMSKYKFLRCYVCGTRVHEPNIFRNIWAWFYQHFTKKKVYVVCTFCYQEKHDDSIN